MTHNNEATLYERLGGEEALSNAVKRFYIRNYNDPRIKHFFNDVKPEDIVQHQINFMTYAFGGSNTYEGRTLDPDFLREVHAHLELQEEHFAAVAENLVGALEELKVPQHLIDEVVAVVLTTKDAVLNK